MKTLTPLKAIRAKCLDCSCWQPSEVKICPITDCPLFPYRFGKNPNRKGVGPNKSLFVEKTAVESVKTDEEDDLKSQCKAAPKQLRFTY